MRSFRTLVLMPAALAGACAAPGAPPPTLQPRAAETIDPRVPVPGPVNDRPVSAALAARLGELVSQAEAGDAAFAPVVARAEQLAAAAGPRESESWKVAQEALSAAIAARGETARAMGDIDELGADRLQAQGGVAPADFGAIKAAAERVADLDRRQAARIGAVQQRLAN